MLMTVHCISSAANRSPHRAFFASPRHRSEQNRTSSQTRSHFLRHVKGRPQWAQGFEGRSPLRIIFGMMVYRSSLSCSAVFSARLALMARVLDGLSSLIVRLREPCLTKTCLASAR